MTQRDRLNILIKYLIGENEDYKDIAIPDDEESLFNLFRALVNVREPKPIDSDFLSLQDEMLSYERDRKGVVDVYSLPRAEDNIILYKGDITRLNSDAIVNAANSGMTGCYLPCHKCIDNTIHTYSGVELRLYCDDLIKKQGHYERTGDSKITPAFNLPSKYVIHTVGPIVSGRPTKRDEDLLSSSYRSCLKTAQDNNLKSIAFCCISTGEFHFPRERAAEIAINTVREYKGDMLVIFNVFNDEDEAIYKRLLR